MNTIITEVYLSFTSGTSNKGYRSLVVAQGETFGHHTAWGGIGKSFQTKETDGLTQAAALAIHEKVVKEKISKGYRPCAPALLGFTESVGASLPEMVIPTVEWVPMLFVEVGQQQTLVLLEDDRYFAQQKVNGDRRRIVVKDGQVTGFNKRGIGVPVPGPLATALTALSARTHANLDLDGEVIGNDQYLMFDDLTDLTQPAWERTRCLKNLTRLLEGPQIQGVPDAYTTEGKLALMERAQAESWEGLMFKRKHAPYFPGRSQEDLKYKRWKMATLLLMQVHSTAKLQYGSFSMYVRRGDQVLFVGRVGGGFTTSQRQNIGDRIQQGEMVLAEVRYLYYDLAALHQPTFLKERTDMTLAEVGEQPLFDQRGEAVPLGKEKTHA